MVVVKSEFFLALNQVATERGISPEDVIASIEAAVLAAYKKDYSHNLPDEEDIEKIKVKIDKNSGEIHILLDDKDVTPPGFGRIAAQTARQVILQKIREAEKKTIVKQYETQVGSIIKGRVIRYDGKNVSFDIGKTEGLLPQSEQIKSEQYRVNDNFMLYLLEISEDKYGNSRVIVSRTDSKLVENLFKKEVPEISSGTVKIKKVVREPGERAKIAVYSDQSGVDPVGACVGQKGIRVKSVTDELGGNEKIDIIQYNDDIALYIREALSPASVISVEIDKENHAKVSVTEDQAPLVIGKNGVNVYLASKLTGFEIDIEQVETEEKKDKIEDKKAKQQVKSKTKSTKEEKSPSKPKKDLDLHTQNEKEQDNQEK